MKKTVFCTIGAANVDIISKSINTIRLGDSNPGVVSIGLGGVGSNIARNIGLMGHESHIIVALANDAYLPIIQDSYSKSNVIVHTRYVDHCSNSIYLATHDQNGELIISINDMAITEQMTPVYVANLLKELPVPDVLIMDANIPQSTIEYCANHKKSALLVCDSVSTFKVTKLKPILSLIDILKCNRQEAIELTGLTTKDDKALVSNLLKSGVKVVLLTRGIDATLIGADDSIDEYPVKPARKVVSAIGAGDAFLSGFVSSFVTHHDIKLAMNDAMKMSRICLSSAYAVNPLITSEWRTIDENKL